MTANHDENVSSHSEDFALPERLSRTLGLLLHELRVPVVAFRACLEHLEHECKQRGYDFRYDHFGDMEVYCDVMNRLLRELDILRRGPRDVPLNARAVRLLADIVTPTMRFIRPLLNRRGFSASQISHEHLQSCIVLNFLDTAAATLPSQAKKESE